MRALDNSVSSWLIFILTFLCVHVQTSAPAGPWDAFNFAPGSKVVRPTAIYKTIGDVQTPEELLSPSGRATLRGNGSYVTLDFGKEVGGLVSLNIQASSKTSSFSLSFAESRMFVNPLTSDDSNTQTPNMSFDGVLPVPAPLSSGLWTMPSSRLRGGFRFLTLVSNAESAITLSNVSVALSFSPNTPNLRDYSGYFYAKDPQFSGDEDFLTKIWYAGAYTVQTNVLAVDQGRTLGIPSPGWGNNATIGVAGPVLVDGARRDEDVWAGDLGISLPTQFVSTNNIITSRNSIATLFGSMSPTTGAIPYCGPPLCTVGNIADQSSDTYHAWTLIGLYTYVLYSGDLEFLEDTWANYTKAISFLEAKVTSSGLLNVTNRADWARIDRGGVDSEGNALYYKILINSAQLALLMNDTALAEGWLSNATVVKQAFNDAFWSESLGMYTDNATTTLTPQDGNSMAVVFNLTTSAEQADSISRGLEKNWNAFGAVAPEAPDTIAPFIGGFELQAHFISGNDKRALDLLRREWGYMLTTNLSVQSTLLEGYTANGSLYYRSALGYDYDPSYTSHAHGWSTGPTSALTFYVLGLQVTSLQGRTWSLAPHIGDLSAAEGGFETPLGWFGAKWVLEAGQMHISIQAPEGTEGVVTIPGNVSNIQVDGITADVGTGRAILVSGGSHTIII